MSPWRVSEDSSNISRSFWWMNLSIIPRCKLAFQIIYKLMIYDFLFLWITFSFVLWLINKIWLVFFSFFFPPTLGRSSKRWWILWFALVIHWSGGRGGLYNPSCAPNCHLGLNCKGISEQDGGNSQLLNFIGLRLEILGEILYYS